MTRHGGRQAVGILATVGVLLLGCAVDDDAPPDPPGPATAVSEEASGRQPATSVAPDGTAQGPPPTVDGAAPTADDVPLAADDTDFDHPDLPPELAELFPEGRIGQMVDAAEAAYRAHYVAYDAAAATGFTDPDLVEEVRATVGGDTLAALDTTIETLAGTGRVVDGVTEVVAVEPSGLFVGEGGGAGVALVVCLRLVGRVLEADGSVVTQYPGEDADLVVAWLVEDGGRWVMVSQRRQDEPCPGELAGR